jgi:hypothetical protein
LTTTPFSAAASPWVFNGVYCAVFGVISTDVNTVALHEFGHWGSLGHTVDGAAVMVQQLCNVPTIVTPA